jgi:hypothetical protein
MPQHARLTLTRHQLRQILDALRVRVELGPNPNPGHGQVPPDPQLVDLYHDLRTILLNKKRWKTLSEADNA